MTDEDFFAELEAEIAVELDKQSQIKEAEKLRKRANNMRLTTEDRTEARQAYHALQDQLEAELWCTVSWVALFSEQTCDGCGSVHRTFLQYMKKQEHKQRPSLTRFVRVDRPKRFESKANMVMIQPLTTHICSDCCSEHDFDFAASTTLYLTPRQALTVSPEYEQGDINEEGEHAQTEED